MLFAFSISQGFRCSAHCSGNYYPSVLAATDAVAKDKSKDLLDFKVYFLN